MLVSIWADTGQVDYVKAIGYGGMQTPAATSIASSQTQPLSYIFILIGIILALIISTLAYFSLKTRRLKS
jgi:hypothetical protein